MTNNKKCQKCGCGFFADEPWKKICLDCWRREKNREKGKASEEFRRALDQDAEIYVLRVKVSSLETQLQREIEKAAKKTIPPDKLNALIRLSHPDRHGGSAVSNEITAWLLGLRQNRPRID